MRAGPPLRLLTGLLVAGATGLLAAFMDTRPGFDDTGVLVTGLLLGGGVAGFLAGRAGPVWLAVAALVAGLPTPLAELAGGGSAAAFTAVAFAAVGVAIGAIAARAMPAPEPGAG